MILAASHGHVREAQGRPPSRPLRLWSVGAEDFRPAGFLHAEVGACEVPYESHAVPFGGCLTRWSRAFRHDDWLYFE